MDPFLNSFPNILHLLNEDSDNKLKMIIASAQEGEMHRSQSSSHRGSVQGHIVINGSTHKGH